MNKSLIFLRFAVLLTSLVISACGATPENRVETVERVVPTTDDWSNEPLAGCEEFQRLIDKTYTFKPSKLTPAERTTKSGEMDAVWEKVKADKKLIPCLKAALLQPTANSFFRFDGSNLLVSLDRTEESKRLLLSSYAYTDLADVNVSNWIAYLLVFGLEGMDTSAPAEVWLKATDPFYYLPQHGTLKVSKTIGALAIYGSMDERYATPALSSIAGQMEHPGREIATDLLIKQLTPEAAMALSKLDRTGLSASVNLRIKTFLETPTFILPRSGPAKASRERYVAALDSLGKGKAEAFMELVSEIPDGEKDAVVVLRSEDVPLIRKARRFFASTGTPHAPEWYQSFTDILMYLIRKPEVERSKKETN